MTLPRRLGATYRLELRPGFDFSAAAAVVPYLSRLGVETVYCSPIAEAVPGSRHGYDGIDPTVVRRELGGEGGYETLVAACEDAGLGICVDHVPNHLATWHRGPWWRRLLAEGRHSSMGDVFDVDWEAGEPGERGKVALPLLDRPLAEALAAGMVGLGTRDGEPVVTVGSGVDLPVAGGVVRPGDGVADVLAAQHYRLVDWHDPRARNYRRFFDIDGLAGVRVEVPEVFEATHRLVLDLARDGRLSAIRVDHVDGLREPAAYLRRLAGAAEVPVIVEKILTGDEVLPEWPVAGTTGYEVVDDVDGALVDPDGYDRLVAAGRHDGDEPVGDLTIGTRRLVSGTSFLGDLERAARHLGVPAPDLTEVVVQLARYRTYLDGQPSTDDAGTWRSAAGDDAPRRAVVDTVLEPERREAALSLQQLTGAVMAKGIEDTAWYRLSGPLAFCEVGGDPARDRHGSVERLHARAEARARSGRAGLVPGTTHDTKRSRDVRSRLCALSEMPGPFEEGLARLRVALGVGADGGDLAGETRVLAQLLLGTLPPLGPGEGGAGQVGGVRGSIGDAGWPEGDGGLAERLSAALRKSAREAKVRSSWLAPDEGYEARLVALGTSALAEGAAIVRHSFGTVVDEVARLGAVNSLSAVVLRHALPGTPDCYEGDEAWNLSLVDPDNRRPVDFEELDAALRALPGTAGAHTDPAALRRSWRDGRVKLFVNHRCLLARASEAGDAFDPAADYLGLATSGAGAGSVIALARVGQPAGGSGAHVPWAIAVVTRRAGALSAPEGDLPAGASYAGAVVRLPEGCPVRLTDALSGRAVTADGGRLDVAEVLGSLPVALLTGVAAT